MVQSIELIFENGESADVSAKDIDKFCMNHTANSLKLMNGHLEEMRIVDDVLIKIKPEGNKHFNSFGEESKEKLFERVVKSPDIAQIAVQNQIDKLIYFPKYNGDENNNNQHSWIDGKGNLWILILKDHNVESLLWKICYNLQSDR